jgi:SAM-dependent methyltransferase
MDTHSFTHYLKAKKSVDDQALNLRLWQMLKTILTGKATPLRVLEIGGGVGTMLTRMLEDDLLPNCEYTLLDVSAENIARAPEEITTWGQKNNTKVDFKSDRNALISAPNGPVSLKLVCADIFEFIKKDRGQYNLLVAHAVLDLFDLDSALPQILSALQPDGLCYFTINFDGLTLFEPAYPSPFEDELLARYHQSMDKRIIDGEPSGDSRSGRHLFGHLRDQQVNILAAGSSDWVVYANQQGYPAEEAYFLAYLIETIYRQLNGHPQLTQEKLKEWTQRRSDQIAAGDLVCIVHQLDFLGQVR